MRVPNLQFNVPPMIQLPNEMQGFSDALLKASALRRDRLLQEQQRQDMLEQREYQRGMDERRMAVTEGQFGLAQEQAARQAQMFEPQLQTAQQQADMGSLQLAKAQEQQAYEESFAQALTDMAPQLEALDPMQKQVFIAETVLQDPTAPAATRVEAAQKIYELAKEESEMAMRQAKFQLDSDVAKLNLKIAEHKLAREQAMVGMEQQGLTKGQLDSMKLQYDHIQKNRIDPLQGSLKSFQDRRNQAVMYANQMASMNDDQVEIFVQNNSELQGILASFGVNKVDRKAVEGAMKDYVREIDAKAKTIQADLDRVIQDQEALIQTQSMVFGAPNFLSPYQRLNGASPEVEAMQEQINTLAAQAGQWRRRAIATEQGTKGRGDMADQVRINNELQNLLRSGDKGKSPKSTTMRDKVRGARQTGLPESRGVWGEMPDER